MTNRQHSERSAQSQRYAEGEQPTASTVAKEPEATMSTQEQPNPSLAPTPEIAPPVEPVAPDAPAPQVFRAMTREELEAATAPPPPPPPPPFRAMTREDHAASFSALPATLPSPDQPDAGPCRKVAILGFTDSWKTAPFDDPTWEIWGLNELYLFIPRWTRWFELHQRDVWMADTKRTQEHLRKLAAMTCPVYMHQHWPDIPCSVPYPLQDVANAFRNPAGGIPYLTNSISLMIALALLDGFTEIKVCGVDMSHDCLHPDMRVLTADLRWVPAGELTVGQELLAFDEEVPVTEDGKPAEFRKYRKTTVESLSRVKRPCHRLQMADGTSLIASEGHQWLTALHKWCRTDQLVVGDSLLATGHGGTLDIELGGEGCAVSRADPVGEQEVVGIRTGTQTLIVEGFASHNSEYQSQRPSCEYFVGIAQGRGVQITLPQECELLKTDFIYGYQQPELERWNARMLARERDFDQKLQQIDQQIAQLTEARGQYRGALQDTQHIRKNWKGLIAA